LRIRPLLAKTWVEGLVEERCFVPYFTIFKPALAPPG
jgi:hypothetical protein